MHPEALSKKGREIFPKLKNFKGFYLAGGTALALQIEHRISFDFDLFSDDYILKNLFSSVKKVFSDKKIIPSVNNPDELTVFIDEVKITFLRYPFPPLGKLVSYKGIALLSVKEIAASKAYTIGRRGSYKDYIDLYFIISNGYSSLPEIIKSAEKKYKTEFNSRLFLEQLIYFEDIKDTEISFLKKPVKKEKLENFFVKEIRKIKI